MTKRSEYIVKPEEELDLKHQGSVRGDQLMGRYGRAGKEVDLTSLENLGTPGRAPAEGPDVAMSSPSHERSQENTAERAPSEGQEQTESPKKHHYK